MRSRISCVLFSLLLLGACTTLPDSRRAPMVGQAMLLESDPADVLVAMQTNAAFNESGLYWTITRKHDDDVISEGRAALVRQDVEAADAGLPPARRGQQWSLWRVTDEGQQALRATQQKIADEKAQGHELGFSVGWNFGGADRESMPDAVQLTWALRQADGDWFTLLDNASIIPENTND